MKRNYLGIIGAAAVGSSLLLGAVDVSATDLSSSVGFNDYLNGLMSKTFSYDATNDVTTMKVTVTLTEALINQVLTQKSGNPSNGGEADQGSFYIEMAPTIDGAQWKKANKYFAIDKNIADAKVEIDAEFATESLKDYAKVWPFGMFVQYKGADGKWVNLSGAADGTKTIRQYLLDKLGAGTELEYGENFRFYMYTNYYWLYGYEAYDENGAATGAKEYVKVEYELNFPISADIDGREAVYFSLNDALESDATTVTVNETLTVDEDVVIPEGKTLKIADGKQIKLTGEHTLTIEKGAALEDDGNGNSVLQDGEVYEPIDLNVEEPEEDEGKGDEGGKGEAEDEEAAAATPDTGVVGKERDGVVRESSMIFRTLMGVAMGAYLAVKSNKVQVKAKKSEK